MFSETSRISYIVCFKYDLRPHLLLFWAQRRLLTSLRRPGWQSRGDREEFDIFDLKEKVLPWLVWLSGLSTGLRTGPVQVPVRAHVWVADQVPSGGGVWEATTHGRFSPSLSPSFLLSKSQ